MNSRKKLVTRMSESSSLESPGNEKWETVQSVFKNSNVVRYLYWLVPALMYLVGETVTGNLGFIGPVPAICNLAIYYLLYIGVFLLFRTTKFGWPVLSLGLFLLATAEYFVISFRERPAMFWDILAIRTAMTVSANYKFTITPVLAGCGLATLAMGYAVWKWPLAIGSGRELWKGWFGRVAAWSGGSLVFGVLLFGPVAQRFHLDVPMWDPVVSFEKEGFLLSTVLSFKAMVPPKPEEYSAETAEELLEAFVNADVTEDGSDRPGAAATTPENIICIMNESFSDLRIFNGLTADDRCFETDKSFLEYFDSLSENPNTQKGSLYVPVFGAMTANSEYEFLTGNSCAFVPQGSIPYQFYTKPGDNSLAKIFSDRGYTTIAMHPYPGYNWNRTEAYKNLGFDQFLDQEFYDELEAEIAATQGTGFYRPRDYMSDRSDYDSILHLIRKKDEGEKLFLFNVTMQNHGGFEVEDLESAVHVTELNGEACEGQYPKADQYLTLIQMSDEALKYFLEELETVEEPTMVVLFGDHQPSVETHFFEALYGMKWTDVPDERKVNSFKTPYIIWTNYEREVEDPGDMSAFMLGNEVLKVAGVEPDGVFAAAEPLRKQYDAVHAMGVIEKDGTFTGSRDEDVFNESDAIREFHMIQYFEIFE